MSLMEALDQMSNVIAVLIPIGTVLYAIWRRIGGVLIKLDTALATQVRLAQQIDKLEKHQDEINGGIVKHMKEDMVAMGELKAAIAHVEGRLDERERLHP